MVLKVKNLCVARGGVRILDGVSFDLGPGRILLLRGPNGIGKTTLLRTVAGLQSPVSGHIEMPSDGLSYAGHLDGVKPTLTVAENLTFWSSIFGRGDLDQALKDFDLNGLKDRAAGQLSAGQKRRLGLARLVVTGRKLWALDEPTVSLDAAARALFEGAVMRHVQTGGAALIATHHDLDLGAADTLDLAQFRANGAVDDAFDEAFL